MINEMYTHVYGLLVGVIFAYTLTSILLRNRLLLTNFTFKDYIIILLFLMSCIMVYHYGEHSEMLTPSFIGKFNDLYLR